MNQFERLELLIGKNNIDKIQNTTVLIIGLGGVGSYATEALIRSGIKKIILVDNDKIDITNLNRQLMTNYENVGKFKTEELKKRIQSINKFIEVKCITKFIDKTNIYIRLSFGYKADFNGTTTRYKFYFRVLTLHFFDISLRLRS